MCLNNMQKLIAIGILASVFGCKRDEVFPAIGTHIASPVDVETSADGQYFYVLNADLDRTYNKGSVLVLDQEGNKVTSVEVPRLGRNLQVAGSLMTVTSDPNIESNTTGKLILFDLTDPKSPKEAKTFDIECLPMNVALRKNYNYFAVSCMGGDLWIGEIKTPLSDSQIHKVRSYGDTRRAIYLDTNRNLVLAFSTDLREQDQSDMEKEDKVGYPNDDNDTVENAPNEVPDEFEIKRGIRKKKAIRLPYLMSVYDITAGQAEGFTFKTWDHADVFNKELRWLYFSLTNFDGTPISDTGVTNLDKKYYRTNFWEAQPDENDSDVFYLSHRGRNVQDANSIIKVAITGNLRPDASGKAPKTADVLQFTRVYGFKGELNPDFHYPGDFKIVNVTGQNLLLVNHFPDLFFWPRKEVRFSIAAKSLDQEGWYVEESTGDAYQSYYGVAANQSGIGMSCAFYGNAVIRFKVNTNTGISELKRIE